MKNLKQHFEKHFETMPDGCVRPISVEDLSTEDWRLIYQAVTKLGYGMHSVEDTKAVYSRYVGKNGFNIDQSEAIKAAYGIVKQTVVRPHPKREAKAAAIFGLTDDFREAGYILRNGTMLDFSEKRDGGVPGMRAMDHRRVNALFTKKESESYQLKGSSTPYMNRFIAEGSIRLTNAGVTIGEMEPTAEQYTALSQFVEYVLFRDDRFTLDLSNNSGHTIIGKIYDPSTRPQQIIRDIKTYFRDGLPDNL